MLVVDENRLNLKSGMILLHLESLKEYMIMDLTWVKWPDNAWHNAVTYKAAFPKSRADYQLFVRRIADFNSDNWKVLE